MTSIPMETIPSCYHVYNDAPILCFTSYKYVGLLKARHTLDILLYTFLTTGDFTIVTKVIINSLPNDNFDPLF